MAGKLKIPPLKTGNPGPFLKRLQGFRFLKGTRRDRAILSLNDQWLKLLVYRNESGKPSVRLLKALPAKDISENETAKTLAAILLAAGVTKPDFAVSIASFFVRSHFLKLPSSDSNELKIMVDLQVEKLTPDAKDEMMTSFRPMGTSKDGYSTLMLVMAHNDMIVPAVKIVESSPGELKFVTSDVDGIINWLSHLQALQHESPDDAVLLVDIDSDYTTLMISQKGEAYFHRSIPVGAAHLQADPNNQSRLLGELHRSLLVFKEEGLGMDISKIILTGLAEDFHELAERVEKEESVPAQIISSFLPYEISKDSLSDRAAVSFTSLLGLVSAPPVCDLMPTATRLRRTFQRRVKAVIRVGAQLLVALILLSSILLNHVRRNADYEEVLKERVNSTEPEARRIELSLVALKIIRERLEGKGRLLASFMDINKATSESIRWDTYTYVKDEGVVLEGTAGEMPQIFEMVTELEKSSLFLEPKAGRVAKRKVDDKDIAEFEIEAPFFQERVNETETN